VTGRERLDRDAPLALEVHRVEHLRLGHLAGLQRAGQLEKAVGERGLPWSMWAMIEKLRTYCWSSGYLRPACGL